MLLELCFHSGYSVAGMEKRPVANPSIPSTSLLNISFRYPPGAIGKFEKYPRLLCHQSSHQVKSTWFPCTTPTPHVTPKLMRLRVPPCSHLHGSSTSDAGLSSVIVEKKRISPRHTYEMDHRTLTEALTLSRTSASSNYPYVWDLI